MTEHDDDDIDIDALEKCIAEHPCHVSPEDELEYVAEHPEQYGNDCTNEAQQILAGWYQHPTSLEARRAKVEWFFVKWDIGPSQGGTA